MKPQIKTYFIIPTLFAGGAERIMSFVAQNLNKDLFNIKLVVIGFEKDSKFDISGVTVDYLNKDRVLDAVLPIIRLLRKEKPDIMVSSISHLNVMMGLISVFFPRIKFVGRHATINQVANKYRTARKKPLLMSVFNYYDYGMRKLDHIICQSSDMKKDFLNSHDYNKNNITIIQNPITDIHQIKGHSNNDNPKPKRYITVGRLGKIKGHLRLLNILSRLNEPFKYTIIGNGTFKETIFEKIKELELTDNIEYIAYTNNVSKYLVEHDMFLQGSYSEGFPNALLESCVVGTPVIAFDVPGGTKEIVENEVNGFLVNNEEEFLERLKDNRSWNPKTVSESVYKKFNKEKILKQYEDLFIGVLKQ